MEAKLPWGVRALVALRGEGPDGLGFWGNERVGCSRRALVISGEWWVATRWWFHGKDYLYLEPSRDTSLS